MKPTIRKFGHRWVLTCPILFDDRPAVFERPSWEACRRIAWAPIDNWGASFLTGWERSANRWGGYVDLSEFEQRRMRKPMRTEVSR